MQLPTSLITAVCATGSLWAVAIYAHAADLGTPVIAGAFLLGCITAWLHIVR